jgi:membrane protein YdbS with pleckstrin-like domain
METCQTCGAQLTGAARFCASCGASADSEETRYTAEARRVTSEETQLAAPRPQGFLTPQPVRPLTEQPARVLASNEIEQVIFRVRPTLMFVKLGYALAAVGGIVLITLLTLLGRWDVNVPVYVSIPLALALLLIPAFYHIKRNMLQYTLTDSKIEIDEGLISQTTRNIPLRNIQDVTVRTSVLQRFLKFGNLIVDNASEEGGVTILRDIPDPRRHADLLLRELRRWR